MSYPGRRMGGMTKDLLAVYRRAADLVVGVVERVHPDQFGGATPCTEWNVRTLINHVVAGNLFFVHLAIGSTPPDRGVDYLGNDPLTVFRDSVHAMSAVCEADGFLDRVLAAPFGEVPGSRLVSMRCNELTVHGWDLAKATGQSTDLDRELSAVCLASFRAWPWLPNRAGAPFDAEQPAPPGATPADHLAAFLGRKV